MLPLNISLNYPCNEYYFCYTNTFPWRVAQHNTCRALNEGPWKNALPATKAAGAPLRVNVPSDQNIISLLEGQVTLSVASKVILGHHPLYTRLRHLVH